MTSEVQEVRVEYVENSTQVSDIPLTAGNFVVVKWS